MPSIISQLAAEIKKLGGSLGISSSSQFLYKYIPDIALEDIANVVLVRNPWLVGLCIVVTGIVWIELGPAAGAAFGAWNADIIS